MLPDPLLMLLPVIDDYFFLLPIQEAHLLLREQLCHNHPCEGLGDGPDLEDCLLARLFPPLWDGEAVREHVYLAVVIGGLYSYFFCKQSFKTCANSCVYQNYAGVYPFVHHLSGGRLDTLRDGDDRICVSINFFCSEFKLAKR